jgi:hypothetical protein
MRTVVIEELAQFANPVYSRWLLFGVHILIVDGWMDESTLPGVIPEFGQLFVSPIVKNLTSVIH